MELFYGSGTTRIYYSDPVCSLGAGRWAACRPVYLGLSLDGDHPKSSPAKLLSQATAVWQRPLNPATMCQEF